MKVKEKFRKVVLYEDIDLMGHMVEKPQTWVLLIMCIPIVNIIIILEYLFSRKRKVYWEKITPNKRGGDYE